MWDLALLILRKRNHHCGLRTSVVKAAAARHSLPVFRQGYNQQERSRATEYWFSESKPSWQDSQGYSLPATAMNVYNPLLSKHLCKHTRSSQRLVLCGFRLLSLAKLHRSECTKESRLRMWGKSIYCPESGVWGRGWGRDTKH